MEKQLLLTDAQLASELAKCEYCEEKPCQTACPADCSPFEFIMAAKKGLPADFKRAAKKIMKNNPLGGVCGMVCPDRHCMAACSHKNFDGAVNIPAVQATVVQKARDLKVFDAYDKVKGTKGKVAVVGAGPAGLAAAAVLAQHGYKVDIYEQRKAAGGACNLIPEYRLSRAMLAADIKFVLGLGDIKLLTGKTVADPAKLARQYQAVVAAAGLWSPLKMNIPGEERAITALDYLSNPKKYNLKGAVAVIGGGATAADCAVTAKLRGAKRVEMFTLEKAGEMPLTAKEMNELLAEGIELTGRTRVTSISSAAKGLVLDTCKITLNGEKFSLRDLTEVAGSDQERAGFSAVIMAIGARRGLELKPAKGVYYAGDAANGPTTVVEAAAAGKNCALQVMAALEGKRAPKIDKPVKSYVELPGYVHTPVSLETKFFGRTIRSPFLLSAAPPSDGYEQMVKAYEAGWAGGIMKTAFWNVPIHIPAGYMKAFDATTYGNCDNVSGHSLARVTKECKKLVKEWPDRLTMLSTGGPVTGNDKTDRAGWQRNTRICEDAGAYGVEYSLSCPQGGDGTEGDIVSQNAALTAKIIDWIMEVSDPNVPKLFKLTAAVTSIYPILKAIKGVLAKYPKKKAGITLANTFPVVGFRAQPGKKNWEEAIVYGMSGEGVTPISYLTLTSAVPHGIEISGNGGPMDYKAAADFLAIGVKTVQFCTIVMKYG
ncbi:MAG TPA: FAD-dependent oxidoreductase, partial [bacterium]|nr:FAD-dependent oxidoreductase [bacterium]